MVNYAKSSLANFIKGRKQGRRTQSGGSMQWQLGSLLKEKSGFLTAVFATLIFQLLFVLAIVKYTPDSQEFTLQVKRYFLLIAILQFALILILAFVPMHPALKFALFTGFSALTGLMMKAALQRVSHEVIMTALVGTAAMFVTFAMFGAILAGLGIDLGAWGIVLFLLLLALIISGVVFGLMAKSQAYKKAFAIVGLLLFAVYVIFDTNVILQRDYDGDFVTASLDYFLDIINLFLNFVNMFDS